MKVVINCDWGGFPTQYLDYERDSAELIKLVQDEQPPHVKIVEIPDEISDWEISDYDGMETVIYVLDGHLYHASK